MAGTETFTAQLDSVARGDSPAAADVLLGALAKRLESTPQRSEGTRELLICTLELSQIRLKGTDELLCVIVGGSTPETAAKVRQVARGLTVGRLAFIIAPHPGMAKILQDNREARCVVCDRGEVSGLLASEQPLSYLTQLLRKALPLRALIPYDIMRSAAGNMFYGRDQEFGRLFHEEATCFGVTGPGRAGKTSLVKGYMRALKTDRPAISQFTHYIDLMQCTVRTGEGYARLITSKISPRHLEGVGEQEFVAFFQALQIHNKRPLNLILDEVDDLCLATRALELVAEIARGGYVRLILCGRGDLFRVMTAGWTHIARRLELLRIGPLDASAARHLLTEPLESLGFTFADNTIIEEILRLSGRFPHLIQLYARHFAEHLINEGLEVVTLAAMGAVREDFTLAQYMVSPINDLRDPVARLVALTILRDELRRAWSPTDIADAIPGLALSRAHDVMNELVIGNVLTWHGGVFRLAAPGMKQYAESLGYLKRGYDEAIAAYNQRTLVSP